MVEHAKELLRDGGSGMRPHLNGVRPNQYAELLWLEADQLANQLRFKCGDPDGDGGVPPSQFELMMDGCWSEVYCGTPPSWVCGELLPCEGSVDYIHLLELMIQEGYFIGDMTMVHAMVDEHTQDAMANGIMSHPLMVGYVLASGLAMEVMYGEHLQGGVKHAGFIILEECHFRWECTLPVDLECELHSAESFVAKLGSVRVGFTFGCPSSTAVPPDMYLQHLSTILQEDQQASRTTGWGYSRRLAERDGAFVGGGWSVPSQSDRRWDDGGPGWGVSFRRKRRWDDGGWGVASQGPSQGGGWGGIEAHHARRHQGWGPRTAPANNPRTATSGGESVAVRDQLRRALASVCVALHCPATVQFNFLLSHLCVQLDGGSQLMEEFKCGICLDILCKPMITACLHRFCQECIILVRDSID